jgi:hypothetical protein
MSKINTVFAGVGISAIPHSLSSNTVMKWLWQVEVLHLLAGGGISYNSKKVKSVSDKKYL